MAKGVESERSARREMKVGCVAKSSRRDGDVDDSDRGDVGDGSAGV